MKKLIALVAALVMVLGMCVSASAATEVQIWHTFTNDQQAALEKYAADFNASQSDYEVVVMSQAYSGFTDAVFQAVANGVGPSIIFNYASTASDYVKDNLVVDLKPFIYDEEIGMADVYESLPEAVREETVGFDDGALHALPGVTTGPVLFYNKTLYDELGLEPPKTWEELAEQSKKIYEEKGIYGFAADSLTDLMQALMIQSGAGYIDTEAKKVLFDTEEATQWLAWYGENVQAGYFAPAPTGDYYSTDFNAGILASYLGSCAGEPYIVPDGFEFSCAPMVRGIATEWFPSWNRGPIVFNKDEDTNKGAYLFVKYMLTPEVNADWCKAMNALSPYGTTQESDAYKAFAAELSVSLQALSESLDIAGALPSVTGSAKVRDALKEAATLVAGGEDPATVMANTVSTCNAALQAQ